MSHTWSIRNRLIGGSVAALLLIVGAATWASYLAARHEADELFGARLATSARVLEAIVARQVAHATIASPIVITLPPELEFAKNDDESALGHPYETKIAFQIWSEDGALLARSASAPEHRLGPAASGFSRMVHNGEQWRVFVLDTGRTAIHVAEKDEVRDDLLADMGIAVMTPFGIGAVLLLVVIDLLIVMGLNPLRLLTARIEARAPGDIERIDLPRMPDELASVIGALNDLLARVTEAFERERRFTDAAAHELRTPLAALKLHVQNLSRANSEAERARSLAHLELGLSRTIAMAEQMLAYSRAQHRSAPDEAREVDLRELTADVAAMTAPGREARRQRLRLVDGGATTGPSVRGDPVKLESMVRNLLDNASRYGPPESEIEIALTASAGSVTFSVANDGNPIDAALRERVFEPYYRVPGSQADGSGLGLAIVREVATQHRARVELTERARGNGTRVSVTFTTLHD